MGIKYNLTGQQFTYWTVLERDLNYKQDSHIYWKCQCKCGTIKTVESNNLRSGKSKSCGCLTKETTSKNFTKDITGQKFGHLTALRRTNELGRNKTYIWECQCDCGAIHKTALVNLTSGEVQSCGKCRNLYSLGELKIIQILEDHNIKYETQKTFQTCRFPDTNALAFFDFYLPDYNILIEFDGSQHYTYHDSGWNNEQHFIKTKERDEYKNQWAFNNNIKIKRIPYYILKTMTYEDIIGDKFLLN